MVDAPRPDNERSSFPQSPLEELLEKTQVVVCISNKDVRKSITKSLLLNGYRFSIFDTAYRTSAKIAEECPDKKLQVIVYGSENDILDYSPHFRDVFCPTMVVGNKKHSEPLKIHYSVSHVVDDRFIDDVAAGLFYLARRALSVKLTDSEADMIIGRQQRTVTRVGKMFEETMRYERTLLALKASMHTLQSGDKEKAGQILLYAEKLLDVVVSEAGGLAGVHRYFGELTHDLFTTSEGGIFLKRFKDDNRARVEQLVYCSLDHDQKMRGRADKVARSLRASVGGLLKPLPDRSLDDFVDGQLTQRDMLFYVHVPRFNLPAFFPSIASGLFLKKYLLMRTIGGVGFPQEQSLRDAENFNVLNVLDRLNEHVKAGDQKAVKFADYFKPRIEYEKNRFVAYLQHCLIGELETYAEQTHFAHGFADNTKKLGAALQFEIPALFLPEWADKLFGSLDMDGWNRARARDGNWKNMMFDVREVHLPVDQLVQKMIEHYAAGGSTSFEREYMSTIVHLDFDKMGRITHRFEDIVKDAFGGMHLSPAEQKKNFYIALLLQAKYKALHDLKEKVTSDYQIILDIGGRIRAMRMKDADASDASYFKETVDFLLHKDLLGYPDHQHCLDDASRMSIYRNARSGGHITDYIGEAEGPRKHRLIEAIHFHVLATHNALYTFADSALVKANDTFSSEVCSLRDLYRSLALKSLELVEKRVR